MKAIAQSVNSLTPDSSPIRRDTPEFVNFLSEIIIVDDVITTGSTLEQITKCIKKVVPKMSVKSICIFRGKPYYKRQEPIQ